MFILIEVEVKASVKDFEDVRKKLTQIGAIKIKTEHQSDVYYNAPHKDFGETDEALRIRQIPENGKTRVILTYKGAKLDNVSKTRKEIEVDVSDAENTAHPGKSRFSKGSKCNQRTGISII